MAKKIEFVRLQPFDLQVWVLVGGQPTAKINALQKRKNINTPPVVEIADPKCLTGYFKYDTSVNLYCLWFPSKATIRSVVHECFHIVNFVADNRGDRICEATDETYAYSLGKFVDDVITAVHSQGGSVSFKNGV